MTEPQEDLGPEPPRRPKRSGTTLPPGKEWMEGKTANEIFEEQVRRSRESTNPIRE